MVHKYCTRGYTLYTYVYTCGTICLGRFCNTLYFQLSASGSPPYHHSVALWLSSEKNCLSGKIRLMFSYGLSTLHERYVNYLLKHLYSRNVVFADQTLIKAITYRMESKCNDWLDFSTQIRSVNIFFVERIN